jgi:hypothetical protein|nr:MAG TPA: hypothetical protein [Caudoviricetes sp.]
MNIADAISNEYYNWMVDIVTRDRFAKTISYNKLLSYLHSREYTWTIRRDKNRAQDGIDLRRHYILGHEYSEDVLEYLAGPCSILEMMVALAIRCEETIMDDPAMGNRTAQWFWQMIVSLGLGAMTDTRYNKREVIDIIDRFLEHKYAPNGKGGLFTVKGSDSDMRTMEIWYQLCSYLNTII